MPGRLEQGNLTRIGQPKNRWRAYSFSIFCLKGLKELQELSFFEELLFPVHRSLDLYGIQLTLTGHGPFCGRILVLDELFRPSWKVSMNLVLELQKNNL